ncbi:MAG TPA: hypothetical protein VIG24_04895 [Acidimicrobiia bacterium]
MSEVTAELCEGMSFSKGTVWVLQLWTDRKPAARGGLTKGKKGGALVADSVPELLRTTAAFMEQERIDSLSGLAKRLAASGEDG